jgi:lysophospholipase L1-like esterase
MDANSRIITLGDSVAWGQGLLPQHKFASLVAAAYGVSTESPGFMQAHSGAIIGLSDPDATTSVNPEIPASAPMVKDQISSIASPETVDLVLLMAGINDVNIRTIFDPLTPLARIDQLTQQFCYSDMKTLLAKILNTFTKPGVQIRVVGYYPIVGPASNPVVVPAGDPLIHLFANFYLPFLQTVDRDLVLKSLSDRAMRFWTDSTNCIKQTVSELAAAQLAFVGNPFTPDNALFMPDSLLWGFGPDLGPADEVSAERSTSCDIQYPLPAEFFPNEICCLASIGHPTVTGAQAIANAILGSLE